MGLLRKPPPLDELLEFLDSHTNQAGSIFYQVSDKTFTRWLKEYGILHKLRERKDPPSKEELEEYLKTHTLKDAEEHYEVKTPTLRRWLDELDLSHLHFDKKSMISLASAAKELGLSRTMLSVWFREGYPIQRVEELENLEINTVFTSGKVSFKKTSVSRGDKVACEPLFDEQVLRKRRKWLDKKLHVCIKRVPIPGVRKVNATRVVIPRSSIEYLRNLREEAQKQPMAS